MSSMSADWPARPPVAMPAPSNGVNGSAAHPDNTMSEPAPAAHSDVDMSDGSDYDVDDRADDELDRARARILHLEVQLGTAQDVIRKLRLENRILALALRQHTPGYDRAGLLDQVNADVAACQAATNERNRKGAPPVLSMAPPPPSRSRAGPPPATNVVPAPLPLHKALLPSAGSAGLPAHVVPLPASPRGPITPPALGSPRAHPLAPAPLVDPPTPTSSTGGDVTDSEPMDTSPAIPLPDLPATSTTSTKPRGGRRSAAAAAAAATDSDAPVSRRQRAKRAVIPPSMQFTPDGFPQLPAALGALTLHAWGTISSEDGYHQERYIYPIGFTTSRQFASVLHDDQTTTYTCTILMGATGKGPIFQVTAADNPAHPVQGTSPTQCWSGIVRAANLLRGKSHGGATSGPEYFGLTHAFIVYWLQKMPGVAQLPRYVMQDIALVDQRTGAVET
ncbi:hypothetical protein GGF31_000894 [Allomyces arbusculus]|nr:hypothetical protein GGF31_000894 [Allomyces arbusculus]